MSNLTTNQIVQALKLMCVGDDSASVQINNDGRFYLSIGLSYSESFTQSEFYDVCREKLRGVSEVRQYTRATKGEQARQEALSKLTPHERELLGL